MAFRSKLRGTTEDQFDVGLKKVTLDASGVSVPWNFKFPADAGAAGEALTTDGSGNTSWEPVAGSGQTPYLIKTGETFTVQNDKQVLIAEPIEIQVGGTLNVVGHLIDVSSAINSLTSLVADLIDFNLVIPARRQHITYGLLEVINTIDNNGTVVIL